MNPLENPKPTEHQEELEFVEVESHLVKKVAELQKTGISKEAALRIARLEEDQEEMAGHPHRQRPGHSF